jgi:hypothetical protein
MYLLRNLPDVSKNSIKRNHRADPAQIKNYLTDAIKALDSGNNTRALMQVELAGDQLEPLVGASVSSIVGEEEGEVEEGSGEDLDEPGDIDINDDEEDSP